MADNPTHFMRSYSFAGFRFDPRARIVLRGDEPVALPPKSLECLAYLLEHRDRAVGRDELISAVWGRTDVGYAVLAQTLWKARRALGETRADTQLVRTVSRFGYQWVAPVELIDAAPLPAQPSPSQPSQVQDPPSPSAVPVPVTSSPVPGTSRRWRLPASVLAAILVVAGAGVIWLGRSTPPPPPAAEPTAIDGGRFLVLPVTLDAEAGDGAWVRLGVMDYLGARLRESGGVQVTPSDRVVALLSQQPHFDVGDPAQLEQVRLVTGASYVVVPRATRHDGGWKITLAMHGNEAVQTVEAEAASPLDAANGAVERVLRAAGIETRSLDVRPDRLSELLQRIDAASLAGDHARARELAESAPVDLRTDPRLRLKTAQIDFHSGRLDEAAAVFGPLTGSSTGLSDELRAVATMGLAAIAERRQRYGEAIARYGEAIGLLGERGDPASVGQAYMMRGLAEGYLGQTDRSLADFGRARLAMTRAGDQPMLANLDSAIGLAERARGRYGEAAAAFDRAIVVLDRFNMNDRLAAALIGAVGVRLALLDHARALVLSERAWQLAGSIESRILVNYLALVRGYALLANGQLGAAEALVQQLGPIADPASAEAMPDLLLLRVQLDAARHRPGITSRQADLLLDRIEHPVEPTFRTSLGGAVMVLASSALDGNDVALAERLLEHLRRGTADGGDTLRPLALALVEAKILAVRGDAAAGTHFSMALTEADRGPYPDALVTVGLAWARQLQHGGDHETMTMLAGRLAPLVERDFRAARAAAVLYRALGEPALAAAADVSAAALAGERDPHGPL